MKKLLLVVLMLGLLLALWKVFNPFVENKTFKNVVFITIDTLRSDRLPTYGYPRDVAPFLTDIAKKGVIFESVYSQIPHTAPAHATMFTGLFPFQHGLLRNQEKLSEEIFTLPMVLHKEGVEAVAFPAVGFLDGNVSFASSPVKMQLGQQEEGKKRAKWYLNAEEVISNFVSWFDLREKKQQPFFAWIHFYDVHQWMGSGQLPRRYTQMMKESYTEELGQFVQNEHNIDPNFFGSTESFVKMINGYDARTRFVDDQIKRLYQHLESAGVNNETLWVITSDHGEGLGNHNYKGHGEFLYEEQLKVPLFFYSPAGKLPVGRRSGVVQHVDLFPTFVDLLEFHFPEIIKIEGKSLKGLITENASWDSWYAFAERRPKDMQSFRRHWEEGEVRAILDEKYKLIDRSLPGDEFFSLENDPFEMNNLYEESEKEELFELQRLKDELKLIMERTVTEGSKDEPVLTNEQIEELRSLGYL